VKLTLGSNRQLNGTLIGLNFRAFCLSGNPGTVCKSWLCNAGGTENLLAEELWRESFCSMQTMKKSLLNIIVEHQKLRVSRD
jgi:hypothetical protein